MEEFMQKVYNGVTPPQESLEIQELAKENFAKWNDTLQTKDAKQVAALYTEDATFLPTVSGEFKKGQLGAEQYFHHFLEKDPTGVVVDEEVQSLSDDYYLHSGMYNFEVGPADKREIVEARFSFVWKKDANGDWKITHHHSSVRPKA